MVVTNDVVEGDEHRLTVFETFEMLLLANCIEN